MAKKQPGKKRQTGPNTHPPGGARRYAKLIQIGVVCVGLIALVLVVRTVWNNMVPPPPPSLTTAQNQAITSALAEKGYPPPTTLQLDEKRLLAATFMIDDPKSPAYLKGYATESLTTIRDALNPNSPAKSYRVNINGASPDPEMTIKWGHATYGEGDTVHWEPGH